MSVANAPAGAKSSKAPEYGLPVDKDKGHPGQGWLYTPHVIIFITSACVMVVELVAGRLIGRHLGSSLYTWTSIIAVVLAGMSIGNFLGGRMADRWNPKSFLGWLFLIASAMCLVTLALNTFVAEHTPYGKFSWPLRTAYSVLTIFLLPALSLGTISPVTAKMALGRSTLVGKTIGTVYAWGAVGSILGTLATGFFLIALLGSKAIMLVVAMILAVVGLFLGPKRLVHALWVGLLIVLLFLTRSANAKAVNYLSKAGIRDNSTDIFARDSNYQYVTVYEDTVANDDSDDEESEDTPEETTAVETSEPAATTATEETSNDESGQRIVRVLRLDFLEHGYIDPKDPYYLNYDYEDVYSELVHRFNKQDQQQLKTFFIGGGSYTFPRWINLNYPGSTVHVAEIDPMVLEANYVALGLPRDTPIKTFLMDARNAVDDLPKDQRYDFVFGDAFNDLSVPWHLLTLEFATKVKRHLTPNGAYLVNVIDSYDSGRLVGAYYLTLKKLYKNVYIFSTNADGVNDLRDTFVIAASDADIDVSDWLPNHESDNPGSVLTDENIASLVTKSRGIVLTDDYCPVENLLAPVVKKRE